LNQNHRHHTLPPSTPSTSTGKLFHSGLPHKAVNPVELAMDALADMQGAGVQQG
jgi:hypothetical protein